MNRPLRSDRAAIRRRRLLAAMGVALGAAILAFTIALSTGDDDVSGGVLVPRNQPTEADPLAYESGQDEELEGAAAFGLSHPLYARSPGGVFVAARRTESFRPQIDAAVEGSGLSPEIVEAIVFLESGGRPDVIAGDDPARASGLTQILAETATSFLGMEVDLAESRRLTERIRVAMRGGNTSAAKRLRAERRAIDARFDPEQALAGTVRYLTTARARLGRDDLAVVSYHMGIGNLTSVLRAYAGDAGDTAIPALVDEAGLSWARVFFDTTPGERAAAYRLLARLGDDSPTYYWRVLAAQEIMRLYRDDPERLLELDELHRAKASAEEVLHPRDETERFVLAEDLESAWSRSVLLPLPDDSVLHGFTVDPSMGELAPRLDLDEELYRGLRPEALATLLYIADRVRTLGGTGKPLEVTSSVRDNAYQALLREQNIEATAGYSLHTTGYAFDIRRRYASDDQARAFQFVLDDLSARGLIAWVREPAAIHITVASAADVLVPVYLEASKT